MHRELLKMYLKKLKDALKKKLANIHHVMQGIILPGGIDGPMRLHESHYQSECFRMFAGTYIDCILNRMVTVKPSGSDKYSLALKDSNVSFCDFQLCSPLD